VTQEKDAKLAKKRRLADALRRNLGQRKTQRGLRDTQEHKAESLAKANKTMTSVVSSEP
jgi:translation initiation factor 2B subunit (eIF-2B alpha/beta/delta family)